jgi:hypothetical protein
MSRLSGECRFEPFLGQSDVFGGIFATRARHTPVAEAVYHLCGLRLFLRAYVSGITGNGVPLHRIRCEFFGPADEFLTAQFRWLVQPLVSVQEIDLPNFQR